MLIIGAGASILDAPAPITLLNKTIILNFAEVHKLCNHIRKNSINDLKFYY